MRLITFASGSGGNCALVSDNNSHILIDAGISARRINVALSSVDLSPDDISGIIITHEHSDHISGLSTMIKKYSVPIYAPSIVANHLRQTIAGIETCLSELSIAEHTNIGTFSVIPFPTPHDTPQSVGYRIEGSAVLGFATDMGHITDEIIWGLTGADAVLIEANHDVDLLRYGKYPHSLKVRILSGNGHLSNADCAELALYLAKHGTRHIVLGHLSRENNSPVLAEQAVSDALTKADLLRKVYVAPASDALILEFFSESVDSRSPKVIENA